MIALSICGRAQKGDGDQQLLHDMTPVSADLDQRLRRYARSGTKGLNQSDFSHANLADNLPALSRRAWKNENGGGSKFPGRSNVESKFVVHLSHLCCDRGAWNTRVDHVEPKCRPRRWPSLGKI
jgi:hypothetical protein